MKNMKKIIVFIIAILAYGQTTLAQDASVVSSSSPGWHKIGEVKADFKTERESITVFGKDKFKAVKFKVTDAPITIEKIVVRFEDDRIQEIPLSGVIQPGSETGTYNLKDPAREIKKVTFTYKSDPNYKDNKAHVELFGLK